MTRTLLPLPLPWLCLALLLAWAPLAARAQEPDDPNSPISDADPCFDTTQVEDALSLFADPNAPTQTQSFFSGLPKCPDLCKKAGVSCSSFAKRAAACHSRFADDRARAFVKTVCGGLSGTALKDCAQPFETKRLDRRNTAAADLASEVTACGETAATCAATCSAAPVTDPGIGTLYTDLVCRKISDAADAFQFADSFVGLPNCAQLCQAARVSCRRTVDDATSCQLAFANDFIASDVAYNCAGDTGSRLRDCKAGFATDLATWRAFIRFNFDGQFVSRGTCDDEASSCVSSCTGQ